MDETIIIRTIHRNEKFNYTILRRLNFSPLTQINRDNAGGIPVITGL